MRPLPRLPIALALAIACGLAGCSRAENKASPEPVDKPSPAAADKPSAEPVKSPARDAAGDRGFVITEIKPAADNLSPMLQAEVAKARSQSLKPFVEFWASWCEPCMAIKHSLSDPAMKAAFKGAYVIQINADEWQDDKLKGTGFAAGAIPVFYELGDDGKPTGRKIDGGAWGENVPANMAPPLDKFFHGS